MRSTCALITVTEAPPLSEDKEGPILICVKSSAALKRTLPFLKQLAVLRILYTKDIFVNYDNSLVK